MKKIFLCTLFIILVLQAYAQAGKMIWEKTNYQDAPGVFNASRPNQFSKGLQNKHPCFGLRMVDIMMEIKAFGNGNVLFYSVRQRTFILRL